MQPPKLALNPITMGRIDKGAYIIGYTVTTAVPPGSKLLLCVGNDQNTLDVTGRPKTDLIGADNLPQLLERIDQEGTWGGPVNCFLRLMAGNTEVAKSSSTALPCPVRPYGGPLNFNGIAREVPPLTYPGNGHGRVWVKIGGKRYFCLGSKLETANANRGFDCTTFPMALFECYPSMAGKYGTALADALGAVKCDMEQKKVAEVKAFFGAGGKLGLFYMWSAGHVVLVHNGTIHEFTYGGYKASPAAAWGGYSHAPQGLWWVRKLNRVLPG